MNTESQQQQSLDDTAAVGALFVATTRAGTAALCWLPYGAPLRNADIIHEGGTYDAEKRRYYGAGMHEYGLPVFAL